ncbi:MAG: methyltransferase domain-containing protein [Candidatus Micrarchaeia archaeon]
MKNDNPLVSVNLISLNLDSSIKYVLNSLEKQSYKNFELIFASPNIPSELLNAFNAYSFRHVVLNSHGLSKSGARNLAISKSKGEYILIIDDDMILSPSLISDCVNAAGKNKFDAVDIPEVWDSNKGFFDGCMKLEKELVNKHRIVSTPRFFTSAILKKIGGFDKYFNEMDEAAINIKLKLFNAKLGVISSHISIFKPYSLFYELTKKFKRGQEFPLFQICYPKTGLFKKKERIRFYFNELAHDPFTVVLLLKLKFLEFISFKLGFFNPTRIIKDAILIEKNKKLFDGEAKTYEDTFFVNTPGAGYVDKKEKDILLSLLKKSNSEPKRILDMGCGSGRWSRYLLELYPNAVVYSLDIAPDMLKQTKENLKKFGKRSKTIESNMENIPFDDAYFDLVVTIRALKYVPNVKKVFSEVSRVLKSNGVFVFELPYPNFILKTLSFSPIFSNSKIIDYSKRIKISNPVLVKKMLSNTNFPKQEMGVYFSFPATFFAKGFFSKGIALKFAKFLDKILPKPIFGRSVFMIAKKEV